MAVTSGSVLEMKERKKEEANLLFLVLNLWKFLNFLNNLHYGLILVRRTLLKTWKH